MSTIAGVSDPSYVKRLESLVALALSGAAAGRAALVALQNKDLFQDSPLDNVNAPNNYILAAANVTRKGSGVFVVTGSWTGHAGGADTVSLVLASIPGPTVAFAGGALSALAGTIRAAHGGVVTATGTGATTNQAVSEVIIAGAATINLSAAAQVFLSGPAGQTGLLLLQLNGGTNMTAQQLNSFAYHELP